MMKTVALLLGIMLLAGHASATTGALGAVGDAIHGGISAVGNVVEGAVEHIHAKKQALISGLRPGARARVPPVAVSGPRAAISGVRQAPKPEAARKKHHLGGFHDILGGAGGLGGGLGAGLGGALGGLGGDGGY